MSDNLLIQKPKDILHELGIEEPNEIDIDAIAQFCGATIVYEPLQGCDGRILGNKDRAVITVSNLSQKPKQRFTAGHELGHWIRDRGKIAFVCTDQMLQSAWSQNNPETRANKFAADLLLPESMFLRFSKDRDISFETVVDIAEKFQTSVTATAIQLINLGSFPAILVWVESNKRVWFYRSPHIPKEIWPRESPGPETVTNDIFKNGLKGLRTSNINAAEWIEYSGSHKYQLRESCMAASENLVLTLLWWQNEQQLIDLEESAEGPEELNELKW